MLFMHSCNYFYRVKYLKWLYVFSHFELSIPDRNRHAPDRLIPFPISRNTDFVFPSDFSVPVSFPDQKIQLRKQLRSFPDRSRLFSSLSKSTTLLYSKVI